MWEYWTVQNKTKFMDASHTQKQILSVRTLWWKFISVDDSFSLYWPFGKAAWVALPPLHAAHLPEKMVGFSYWQSHPLQQVAVKLGIFCPSTKSVIPEVAVRLSGIQKKQYLTGYRISPAVGGLVRYDIF